MSASPPAAHQASAPASEPATNETKSSVGLQETLLGLIDPPQPPQDLFTPPPSSEAPPAEEVPPAPPVAATAPAEGEEKHDWEVVNASPSHSPSKDGVNANVSVKGKGKEREKSASSTFSKEGRIGQKIDGVRKVLKSGVFGSKSELWLVLTSKQTVN